MWIHASQNFNGPFEQKFTHLRVFNLFLSSMIKREKQQSQNCYLERSYVVVVVMVISLSCCPCFANTVVLVSINN